MRLERVLNMRLISILAVLLLAAGCATRTYVVTDYDAGYKFAELRTFDLVSMERENVLISPFTYQHLDRVLDEHLSRRYLRVVDEDVMPDFLVTYHIVVEDKLDTRRYNAGYGFAYRRNYFWPYHGVHYVHSGPEVYTQGSLIVDIVDAETGAPLWRGVSERRLRDRMTPQQQRELLGASLLEVLAKFPPVSGPR